MYSVHQTYKVKSSAMTGFMPLCRHLQINPIEILAAEGLPSTAIRRSDLMIPYDSLAQILNHAADEANSPLFGLELSTYQGLKIFGPLGLLASQANTVADSLGVIQKYFHFHASGASIRIIPQGKLAHMRLDIAIDPSISQEQLIELSLALGYKVLCELASEFATDTVIHFRHGPLDSPECYKAFTAARIKFNQEYDALVFPTRLLTKAPSSASENVKRYLENFLIQESDGQEQPLPQRVSKLIYELMPTGEATLTTIAPMLGMNVRSLQRELRQAGTEFRALLDEVRYEIARNALDGDQPITDVALNLGYSELSAFSRAFKRWSGLSPQCWKKRPHNTITPSFGLRAV